MMNDMKNVGKALVIAGIVLPAIALILSDGWISDSNYPFRYRVRSGYIALTKDKVVPERISDTGSYARLSALYETIYNGKIHEMPAGTPRSLESIGRYIDDPAYELSPKADYMREKLLAAGVLKPSFVIVGAKLRVYGVVIVGLIMVASGTFMEWTRR